LRIGNKHTTSKKMMTYWRCILFREVYQIMPPGLCATAGKSDMLVNFPKLNSYVLMRNMWPDVRFQIKLQNDFRNTSM
jgi:hypothetical protein